MRHDLAGKVALVTWGSRGIGAAVARALAGAGADVAITYLSSRQAAEENHQQPNNKVLTPHGGHDIPAAINSPGHRQGHDLCTGLEAQEQSVLTLQRPFEPSLPDGGPVKSY